MADVVGWLIGDLPPGLAAVIVLGVLSVVGLYGFLFGATRLARKDLVMALDKVAATDRESAQSVRDAIQQEAKKARDTAHTHNDQLLERMREQDNAQAKRDKSMSNKLTWIAARQNGGAPQMPPEE